MRSSLKLKIAIGGLGILVLILIPALETKFFAPIKVKRWGILSWDDFQGIPQPFSSYEAAISSSIYIEYDSAKGRYVAYAGQNNIQSWAKRSHEEQNYTLGHEQYHFNITELHARMLNDYIEENADGSLQLFLLRLGSLNIDLKRMQRQYDEDTDHSLIYDKQRSWEYHIDSLLAQKKGWITDHFSGAQVYFTHLSDSSRGLIEDVPYRYYGQYNYDMHLSLSSYQAEDLNYRLISERIKRNIINRSERLKSFTIDTTDTFRVFTISDDSSNYTYYQLWIAKDSYLYQVKTQYPNNSGDTTGYAKIAMAFINSFKIINTDSYWISKLEASDSPIVFSTVSKRDKNKEKNPDQFCANILSSTSQGFYRGPFYRDDGAMLLVYDDLVHPDSLRFRDVLLVNSDWYSHNPETEEQIYFVPAKNIPKEDFTIKFGSVLLQDSVKECYEFYHQTLKVLRKLPEPPKETL